tara:strand:+ start:256 stop:1299 length:1044 start_codon:yes stop_codon:yes gene_type:complete
MKKVGSRLQVMRGTAKQTGGGLRKRDLKYNKHGKIVSKKVSTIAKKNLKKGGYKIKNMIGGDLYQNLTFYPYHMGDTELRYGYKIALHIDDDGISLIGSEIEGNKLNSSNCVYVIPYKQHLIIKKKDNRYLIIKPSSNEQFDSISNSLYTHQEISYVTNNVYDDNINIIKKFIDTALAAAARRPDNKSTDSALSTAKPVDEQTMRMISNANAREAKAVANAAAAREAKAIANAAAAHPADNNEVGEENESKERTIEEKIFNSIKNKNNNIHNENLKKKIIKKIINEYEKDIKFNEALKKVKNAVQVEKNGNLAKRLHYEDQLNFAANLPQNLTGPKNGSNNRNGIWV